MSTIRAFIAIDLPEAVRKRIASMGRELAQSGADVRWVREQNLHLTLKFLGNIEEDRLDSATRIVRDATARLRPFDMQLHGTGVLPGRKRPRVVYVGAGAPVELFQLAGMLGGALDPPEPPGRRFLPHITIGRVRSGKAVERLVKELDRHDDTHFGEFTVKEAVIYESVLGRNGPTYTVRANAPLGGAFSPKD